MTKFETCPECWKLEQGLCPELPGNLCLLDKPVKLFPFQREDATRMSQMPDILQFSEMRTGKTIVHIAHVQEQKLWPCIVICPTSLKLHWWDEINKWTNEEPFYCETLDELVKGYIEGLENRCVPKYFIIHHEALAYMDNNPIREVFPKIHWKCAAIDESHQFRNLHINRTRTLLTMRDSTEKFAFITGTPIVNSTFDLFPILKTIGMEQDENRFISHYTWGHDTKYGYKISGNINNRELLERIAPIYVRRTQAEVGMEMPTTETVRLTMPPDQRLRYNNYEEMMCMALDNGESISSANILSLNTRLRQLSLDPKILGIETHSSKTNAVLDLISQGGSKWVVASTSKIWINLMKEKIPNSVSMTGDDNPAERSRKVYDFNHNNSLKVFLTTIFTGGLGINLSSANNIIIADPWWQGVIIQQQADRVRSIMQTKPVTIWLLVNTNSIDEDMYVKVNSKISSAKEIIVEQEVIRAIYERRRGIRYDPQVMCQHEAPAKVEAPEGEVTT